MQQKKKKKELKWIFVQKHKRVITVQQKNSRVIFFFYKLAANLFSSIFQKKKTNSIASIPSLFPFFLKKKKQTNKLRKKFVKIFLFLIENLFSHFFQLQNANLFYTDSTGSTGSSSSNTTTFFCSVSADNHRLKIGKIPTKNIFNFLDK